MRDLEIAVEPHDFLGLAESDKSSVIVVRVGAETRTTTVARFSRGCALGAIKEIVPVEEQDAVARQIYRRVGLLDEIKAQVTPVVWDQRWKR